MASSFAPILQDTQCGSIEVEDEEGISGESEEEDPTWSLEEAATLIRNRNAVHHQQQPLIHMYCRKLKGIALVLFCTTTGFIFLGTLRKSRRPLLDEQGSPIRAARMASKSVNQTVGEGRYLFHPFLNKCKFPLPNIYASDITEWTMSERLRQLKCPYEDYDMASMDSEGYMYVHPHFSTFPNTTKGVKCKVVFIEGGLRKNGTNTGHTTFAEVAVEEAPENTRFYANADAFYIRCYKEDNMVFEKVYAGIRDFTREKNKLYISKDTPSFGEFGDSRKTPAAPPMSEHYSVDILAIESTSRTMFMRHMPRTLELMNQLGYHILYGYNKIGDNSMVNLEPILAGDIAEALANPMNDASGDINPQWILPTRNSLDPTLLPFLWKMMKEKFGCRSMFNDDIAVPARGIFHYPEHEFKPGFTSPPSDHYYRAYYLAVYKNWYYRQCKDGGQIQREFIDLWRRFAQKYKNVCHFGFTFITSITHEDGFTLETLDEYMRSSIENLQISGALDRTVSIIMGDHGNRIGRVQYTYTGRIEERMPLMAIRLPTEFERLYPNEYKNFLANKWKLTSNFDIHKTLRDVVLMRFRSNRHPDQSSIRGIGLFERIPANRSCHDAYISENFCTCMVDRSDLTMPTVRNPSNKSELARKKHTMAIGNWMKSNNISTCFDFENITILHPAEIMGLNPLVRYGHRSKANSTAVEMTKKKYPKMDFLYHQFHAQLTTTDGEQIQALFRIEEEVATNEFRVAFEPAVRQAPESCPFLSVFDVCECITSMKDG